MAFANGENHKIAIPEHVRARLIQSMGVPTSAEDVKEWTKFGRKIAAEIKRLGTHPDVTLNDLRESGVEVVPFAYANAVVTEASGGKVTLGKKYGARYPLVPSSEMWRDLIGDYVGESLPYADANGEKGVSLIHLAYSSEDLRGVMGNRNLVLQYARDRRKKITYEIPVKPHPVDEAERGKNMVKFFQEFRNSLKIEENPLSLLETLPHGTRASRTWGSEVEACAAYGVYPPEGWRSKGDGSLRALDNPVHDDACVRNMDTPEYVVRDSEGVITFDRRYCSCGLETDREHTKEFVSPILYSYHSKGLEYLTSRLGAREKNNTPGMHIHVNATDPSGKAMTPSQLSSLVYGYNLLEPLWTSEYGRSQDNLVQWAKPHVAGDIYKATRSAKTTPAQGTKSVGDSAGLVDGDRYHAVNLQSLRSHGTVEFRAMGPQYNYEHMIRWAHFCREMVNVAQAGVTVNEWRKVRSFRDLIMLFAKYGKETPMPSWASEITPEQFVTERELVGSGLEH